MLAQRPMPNDFGNAGLAWDAAMRAGDFDAAWSVSDTVLAGRDPATRDDPAQPYHERWVWDGRGFAGRRVLVRCYHGLGDTLQFARYLVPLGALASHVTLEVQPALAGLVAGLVDRVHPFDPAAPLPCSEVDVEIMELAHALRLPPEPGPYLSATPSPFGPGHVGLCWEAGGWDPARSIPPASVAPLLGRPLLSLQRGPAATALPLPDPLAGCMDIGAVAGLIAGLDAVITVDTMVAHLAAALGRTTIVLLKNEADWRWGAADRCAWYGSVHLIRQRRPGEWDGMAERAWRLLTEGDRDAGNFRLPQR